MPANQTMTPRTWGTRFDQLPSSPPPSPLSRELHFGQATDVSDDHGPTSDISAHKKDERFPHDASVFVGSLPPSIDNTELTRMLNEHLAAFADIKTIKVVRDSKGGVCAFVQCKDAPSAARLIKELQSAPLPAFAGRLLRFERARAFRSLLISYRTPIQFIPATTKSDGTTDGHEKFQSIELEAATSMKLWKPHGARHYSVLYNAEARDFESQTSTINRDADWLDSNVYLSPLLYDEETIHKITRAFGSIEYFRLCGANDSSPPLDESASASGGGSLNCIESSLEAVYPPPHDGSRSAGMDTRCWEVKWDHRDDAVSALMTLRRVPHLTVTWAHQPGSSVFDHQSPAVFQSPRPPHLNSASYPYHIRGPGSPTFQRSAKEDLQPGSDIRVLSTHRGDPSSSSAEPILFPSITRFGDSISTRKKVLSVQTSGLRGGGVWKASHGQPLLGGTPSSPLSARKLEGYDFESRETEALMEWTEEDFPPLVDVKDKKPMTSSWPERVDFKAEAENSEADAMPSIDSPSSPLSAMTTPQIHTDQLIPTDDTESTSETYQARDPAQVLDIPHTPEFGTSPFTPKTSGSMFPQTPNSLVGDFRGFPAKGYGRKEKSGSFADENRATKELDPTTLFVGGLEMYGPYAWDEEMVRNVFEKYGGVEDIKVIRPSNNKSAFAFVKFDNVDSPAQAVAEEHNRVHNGRQMRVQLRDCNPPARASWKGSSLRRGRFPYYGGSSRYLEPPRHEISADGAGNDTTQHHSQDTVGSVGPVLDSSGDPSVDQVEREIPSRESNLSQELETPRDVENYRVSEPEKGFETKEDQLRHHSPELSVVTHGTSSSLGFNQSHDWFREASTPASATASSSLGSSASATAPGMPYPVQTVSYYPPPSWMQPFAPQFSYPMHFGYPGYHMPPPQAPPIFVSAPGSDASGSPARTPNPWAAMGGLYAPFIPYTGYSARPPNTDQSQGQAASTQAPLVPTGFIQGEQGTLMPVYHPEALNHYMANAQQSSPVSQPQPQAPVQNAPSIQKWHPYPHPPGFSYLPRLPTTTAASQELQTNHSQAPTGPPAVWMPHPYHLGFPHHPPQQQQHASGPGYMNQSFVRHPGGRGGHYGVRHNLNRERDGTPPPPRRQHRRGHPASHIDTQTGARGVHRDAGEGIQSDYSFNRDNTPQYGSLRSTVPPPPYGVLGGLVGGEWNQRP